LINSLSTVSGYYFWSIKKNQNCYEPDFYTTCLFSFFPLSYRHKRLPSSVKGVVFDTASKRGLSYATISIVNAKDSTLVTFTRADSTGKFKVGSLDKGKYLLSSSYVGFVPVWKPLNIEVDGQQIDMGNVAMTDILNSGDVTVIARRPACYHQR
jgi:hypothetical protein